MVTTSLRSRISVPAAAAVRAGGRDDLAFAATHGARRDLGELAEDTLLASAYLAGPPALNAGVGRRARLGACAPAARADLVAPDLDLLLGTEDRLLEVDGDIDLKVGPPSRGRRRPARGPAEEGVEDVSEAAEVLEPVETAAVGVDSGMAERVVAAALLRIAENLIGPR